MNRYLTLAALLSATALTAEAKVKLHTIGDSTMQTYDASTDKRGWSQMLQQFFDPDQVTVNNRGKSGASSKSFYKESAYWPTLVSGGSDQMQAGDFLVIQFAHNDEKSNGTDGDEENDLHASLADGKSVDYRGTTPFGTYKDYLRHYIDEAKAMGVKPVLVGPICRKYFSGNTIRRNGRHDLGDKFNVIRDGQLLENQSLPAADHTMDYVYQMQEVAAEYVDVPYIDLTTATADLYLSYGEAYCTSNLFCKDDSTHPAAMGATLIARLFAQLVRGQAEGGEPDAARRAVLEELNAAVVLSSEISFSPADGDLGRTYVGQTFTREYNVSAFGLTPAAGTVTFTAEGGFELSADRQTYSASIDVPYTGSTLIAPVYLRYQASKAGTVTGTLTATNGDVVSQLPLTLEVATLGGEAFSITYPLATSAEGVVEGVGLAIGESMQNLEVRQYSAIDTGKEMMQLIQLSGQAADGSWPAGEIDEVSDRYVQFTFQCPEEARLNVTRLGLHIGGRGGNGLCAKAYYSTDASFSSSIQIFEQSKMTNKQVYEVDQDVALTLEEGERLYIRVYPWYNGAATGKWLCLSNVYVSGTAEQAGGVVIPGSITYGLHTAGTDQTPTFAPEEMLAGFAGLSLTAGSALTMTGTTGWTGSDANVTMTSVYNGTGSSFPSAPTESNTLTFTLNPDDGFYFTPSCVSFSAARFGTDGGTVTAVLAAGAAQQTLCEAEGVNRGGKGLELKRISADVSGIVASSDEPLRLQISFLGLGNTKTMGIADLVIEGTLQGAASSATKYTLQTAVLPAEAGSIAVDPQLGAYKEGTVVTLTALRNFGYDFSAWTDAAGQTLSTDTEYQLTMDTDKVVNACFDVLPVYTVRTACVNDAERPLGSVTLSPNEHDGRYEAGTEITARANGSKILRFMQWTDNCPDAGTSPVRTLTVDQDMELVASFEVQDFVAVFDASRVQGYASNATYPFAADITWDESRQAECAIVRLADGALLKGTGSTPVVRNREGVVLTGLNGLYQNGFRTTDIAWQYRFSTLGFTSARVECQMAAKNMACRDWQALYSLDGEHFTQLHTWSATANVISDVAFDLPADAANAPLVYIRFTGLGEEMLSTSYEFDGDCEGLEFCSHSESGFGHLYVLGTAVVEADDVAPRLTTTLPADGSEGISASGRISLSYDERIAYGEGEATLTALATGESKVLTPVWSSRSVSFDYVSRQYGQSYTLQLPAGYVVDRSGNAAAAATLTFRVMERQAATPRTFDAVVDHTLPLEHGNCIPASADMPAQYRYIQDAINAAPDAGTHPYLIYIREGYYSDPNWTFSDSYGTRYVDPQSTSSNAATEQIASGINAYDSCRVVWVNKPNVHLIGQDVNKVTLATDRLDGSMASDHSRVWYHVNAGATLIVTERGKGFYAENLTIDNENWTKDRLQGPQALCLRIRSDRTIFNNVRARSYQDTYYSAGGFNRQFWLHSTLEGSVDFIYGDGEVFFEGCRLDINRQKGGYIVAPSHIDAQTRWGYVFNNTTITTSYAADPSTYQIYFGRPWHNQPRTVFLHTQCEVTPYAGYWYPTMGGLPKLWAVYDIWDRQGNKLSEESISEYFYTDATGEHHATAQNSLTAEEASLYTLSNVMAGDGTSDPETGVWNPMAVVEPTAVPDIVEQGGSLRWDPVDYAICYVVTVNGQAVAFPTVCSYDGLRQGDVVTIQSVNEHGALSAPSSALTVGQSDAIESVLAEPVQSSVAPYDLFGRRVSASHHGLRIESGRIMMQ